MANDPSGGPPRGGRAVGTEHDARDDAGMAIWPRYLDDRGERVPWAGWRAKRAARREGRSTEQIRAALKPMNTLAGRYGGTMGLLFPLVGVPVAAVLPIATPWAAYAIGGGVVLIAVAPFGLRTRRRVFVLHRAGWLSMGLCASCGYDIAEIEPEQDGCRVCPECEGAWKLDEATEGTRP